MKTFEKGIVELDGREVGTSIFASSCRLHLSTIDVRHVLRTIANAQNGEAVADAFQFDLESLRVVDGKG